MLHSQATTQEEETPFPSAVKPRRNPSDAKKMGRPTIYSPELADAICREIENGKTIEQIEAIPGMPEWTSVRRWLRMYPDFYNGYRHAYEASAFTLENEALTAVRKAKDVNSASAARTLLEGIKWAAAKRNPKVYSDKVAVEHGGEITVVSPEQRRARIAELANKMRAVIDAVAVDVTDAAD